MNKVNYTNRKSCVVQFVLLLSLLFCARPVQAQESKVIGEIKLPESYSILELSTVNLKRGLRLPPLTTTERTALTTLIPSSPTLAKGLMIYNTSRDSIQFWNSTKWVNLKSATAPAAITFSPASVSAAAGTSSTSVTVTSASCATSTGYTYGIMSGSNYCAVSSSGTSTFSVQFTSANTSGNVRTALIWVIDPCGNSAYFVATQQP
jgi:hypothetical protein